MLGGLLLGVVFAIAHHLFYQYLHGRPASAALIRSFATSQETNIAVGTAFAFLVKASLVFAVFTAFIQAFWHTIQPSASSLSRIPSLREIDAAFATPGDIRAIINPKTWQRYPFLVLLAAVTW
jgi:hypothetical protein